MTARIRCAASLILVSCLSFGVVHADTLDIPQGWVGVWETTTTLRDCTTLEILFVSTDLDTICADDPLIFEDPEGMFTDLVCDGTATDETMHVECTGVLEMYPGCSATFTYVSDATRTGDQVEALSIITTDYDAGCMIEDTCHRHEDVSQRTGADPGCGSTPAESKDWGCVKSFYR